MKRYFSFLIAAVALAASFASVRSSAAGMDYVEVKDQKGNVRHFSRLIMGTDHLDQSDWVRQGQTGPTQDQIFAVIDEAVRNGINVIDTSPIYVGGIEHIVGEWLRQRKDAIKSDGFYVDKSLNPDRKIYVLSKGGFPFDLFYAKQLAAGKHNQQFKELLAKEKILADPNSNDMQSLQDVPPGTYASRLFGDTDLIIQRIAEELANTMNNLGDNLTIYLMHRDDFDSLRFGVVDAEQTPIEVILAALSSNDISGKFSLLGVSNWTPERVKAALETARKNPGLLAPRFNSPYFSLFEMNNERSIHARGIQAKHDDMMDPDFLSGVFINPYSPLGGFSILDKPAPAWENAKAEAKMKFESGDAYWRNVYSAVFTPENEIRYQRAVAFLGDFNKSNGTNFTLDQLLNAYALAHQRMDFLTVGPLTVEQVRRTVKALEFAKVLTPDNLDYLYRVDNGNRISHGCRGPITLL